MEQIKRKELKEEDVVCSYMNTETGVIEFSLREGDSHKIDTREQKEYRANHRVI